MKFKRHPDNRHKRIFNLIAPVYGLLDKYVRRNFETANRIVCQMVDVKGKSVLDIGTGTGAWAALFLENGAGEVHGIDYAEKMIIVANKRYGDIIRFKTGDAMNLSNYKDHSFDIVTASFVLHGVKEEKRRVILSEMKRLSKDVVIIHDYYGPTAAFTRFLEYMEKSDYIHFKSNFYNELTKMFPFVNRKSLRNGAAVYIGAETEKKFRKA